MTGDELGAWGLLGGALALATAATVLVVGAVARVVAVVRR